jgi:alpha-mannosidase
MKPIAIHRVNSRKQQKKYDVNDSNIGFEKSFGISFVSISPKNVILSTLKLPQQGYHDSESSTVILRIYESEGRTVETNISFHLPIRSASLLNLLEDDKTDTTEKISITGPHNNSLNFVIHSFKIMTIRVVFEFEN